MNQTERNQYLEQDGLYWASETHEWFKDLSMTRYAKQQGLPNLIAFVLRENLTGEYDRLLMDRVTNLPVYNTKSMEDMVCQIDRLTILKRFDQETSNPARTT